jgi:hypothetical protein
MNPTTTRVAATVCLAVALTLLRSALPGHSATNELDPSWNAVLQYAAANGFLSGKDIVFTYGPLGYLVTVVYAGGSVYPRMFFEFFFVFLNVLPLVLLAQRLPPRWAAAMLGLVALGPPLVAIGKDGLIEFGLFGWGLLCFASPAGQLALPAIGLAVLVGVGGGIKFSWLVWGTGSIAAVLADLILRREWRPAAILATTAPTLFLGLWLLHGQPLDGLVDYLTAAASIASGYASAMGVRCTRVMLFFGISLLSCAVPAIVMAVPADFQEERRFGKARRVLMSLWMLGLTFMIWKYGFVRADGHVLMFGMFAGFLPLAMLALPSTAPRLDVPRKRLAVVAVILSSLMALLSNPVSVYGAPLSSIRAFTCNLGYLLDPKGYRESLAQSWRQACLSMALPDVKKTVQTDSVDVFGCRQTSAIANGLNYTPRPVFQSYTAYNRDLADRNARFYLSGRAPDWVLFELQPIDYRLPSLEDPSCLIEILRGYRFVADVKPFLLLKKNKVNPGTFSLLETGHGKVGTNVDIRGHAEHDLWMEIDVDGGVVALAESILLRPPGLRIRLEAIRRDDVSGDVAQNEEPLLYDAPVAMLTAGFLLSPLLRRNEDVKELLEGSPTTRVTGFTLEPGRRNKTLNGKGFTYRLYAVTPAVGRQTSP